MSKTRVIIMGAAGRDFHNFNVYFRGHEQYEVVAFTATQIPNIENRRYPPELAGPGYPQGIPIYEEKELAHLIAEYDVDQVIFAYSDVSHEYVMHRASLVLAAGADFRLMGGKATMLLASVPVVTVCAVRTGSGKSQTTRCVADILRGKGRQVVVVRHPMPYGDLVKQACQRFATYEDLDRHNCTIEEREEYEPHIDRLPFYKPDLHIVVVDPHRAGHETRYHPGEANLRLADVVVINKIDTADLANVAAVRASIRAANPEATLIEAASPIFVEDPGAIQGKRVLVIEDGPTLTHGGMAYGAGTVAAQRFGAAEIVDPRPYAVNSILETYEQYPNTGAVLPAMGYGAHQIAELEQTINDTPCDMVIVATPIDLSRVLSIKRPFQRVRYELQVIGQPTLEEVLGEVFA